MAREDFTRDTRWDRDSDRTRRPAEARDTEDFGQADYSTDYGYDARRRAGYRAADDVARRNDDFGQADYPGEYDRERGQGYRRFAEDDRDYGPPVETRRDYLDTTPRNDAVEGDRRSWMDRAGAFFSGTPRRDDDVRVRRDEDVRARREEEVRARRRGPSDRVLWAIIVERLEDERRLDLRDLEVIVDNAEVTLNGTVRRKEDKRRIEDIADIDGVHHVQNNLRVRERGLF